MEGRAGAWIGLWRNGAADTYLLVLNYILVHVTHLLCLWHLPIEPRE